MELELAVLWGLQALLVVAVGAAPGGGLPDRTRRRRTRPRGGGSGRASRHGKEPAAFPPRAPPRKCCPKPA